MYSFNQVTSGIVKYIDMEIISKISGWQKWVLGSGIGVAMSKSQNMFETIRNNNVVKALGIVDENGMVDIETLYNEFKKQAEKEPAVFELPMVGKIKLTSEDVDKIYQYIQQEV